MRKIIVIVFCIVCAFSYAKGKKETVATPAAVTATSSSSSSTTSSQNKTQTTAQTAISGLAAIPATGSSCDIRANNNAYNAGYNMISQNGTTIDFNKKTVNEIYSQDFPNNRTSTPQTGGGLAFSDARKTSMEHVEFYTYGGGSSYQLYVNDGFNDRGTINRPASNPSGVYVYVPLNTLPSGLR